MSDEDSKAEIFKSIMLSSVRQRTAEIKSVAISLKALFVLTTDQQVLRWLDDEQERLKEPKRENMVELIIQSKNLQINNIFCDRTGWHCLIAMNDGDTYYSHLNSQKALFLHKLHSYHIESVAWSRSTELYNTKEILLGTNNGVIIEIVLEYDSSSETVIQPTISRVIELPDSSPISGLLYEFFPGLPAKYSVLAASTNRLYQFVGEANDARRPDFQRLFEPYRNNPQQLQNSFSEVSGSMKKSQLQYYDPRGRATCFAWMCGVGLLYGKYPETSRDNLYVQQLTTISFEAKNNERLIGIAMTNHHVYFLTNDSLQIVSKFTQRPVHTIVFETRAGYYMQGITFDPETHSLFAWSNRFIYQILVDNEDRDVWKYYIEQKKYEEAVQFCEQSGSPYIRKVKGVYADELYRQARMLNAAIAYVDSDRSFEEIALKFINYPEALQIYLENMLVVQKPDQKAQKTLLCTWLVEILIHKINSLYMSEDENAYNLAKAELRKFLENRKEDLDAVTTYTLLQSHGRIDDWVYFAELKNNYEIVVLHHINQQQFKKALNILDKIDPSNQESLLYKYAPVFIKNEPTLTVNILIKVGRTQMRTFDPKKLLPALMNVPPNFRKAAIQFEKFCIEQLNCRDKSIHNLLVFHLADDDENALMDYFKSQELLHAADEAYNFDPEYALSVCKQSQKKNAEIYIYSLMRMYSEAVNLALKCGRLDLAKENASKPMKQDDELARKLWIQIAKHLLENSNIGDALIVMRESKLIKMEDIMPYFDEKVSIAEFKEDICKALDASKEKIDQLNEELSKSREVANEVKGKLAEVKQRCIEMDGHQPCEVCYKPAMKRNFYLYPCTHCYHRDCLIEYLLPILKKKDYIRGHKIQSLLDEIQELEGRLSMSHRASKVRRPQETVENYDEKIKEVNKKIDQLLSPNCYFCGPLFIESIRDNLIDDDSELDSWAIN